MEALHQTYAITVHQRVPSYRDSIVSGKSNVSIERMLFSPRYLRHTPVRYYSATHCRNLSVVLT